MNILQICIYYLPSVGGVENFVKALTEGLSFIQETDGMKIKQTVLCYQRKNEPLDSVIDSVHVIRLRPVATFSSQSIVLFLCDKIASILKETKPDIIHFHYPNPLLSDALLKALKKYPGTPKLYVHWHGDIVGRPFLKPWYLRKTQKLLERADKISSDTLEYVQYSAILKKYLANIKAIPAIPNFVSLENERCDFQIPKETLEKMKNRNICFCMGRLVKWKGFQYAIKAFRLLPKDKYLLIIGGNGKYEKKLKRMARGLENIIFVGMVGKDEKIAFLKTSSCFVFPSIGRQESFGISLAEAMYLGTPCILFDIPGLGDRYIANNNFNCLMVEPKNCQALANSIKLICTNKELAFKLSNNAIETTKAKLNHSLFIKSIMDFYFQKPFDGSRKTS